MSGRKRFRQTRLQQSSQSLFKVPRGARLSTDYVDLGGTIRSRSAEQTLVWLKRVFSRVGLTRIARVTGLDDVGIAVSTAVRPLSRTLAVSQGKGLTAELADVSAAMESIELWHSENARRADLRGSYDDLRQRYTLIDPVDLPAGIFPRAVDLRAWPMGWLAASDLVSGEAQYVPRFACALQMDAPRVETLAKIADSTGLAGGNTLEEATCHALCEVIERDATARFFELSAAERAEREIDPATVGGLPGELLARIARAGLSVRLCDQLSTVGVPTFGCVIDERADLRGLGAFGGYGTHLHPEIALCRAITEAAQSRLTIIAGTRDDRPPVAYERMRIAAGQPRVVSLARRSFATTPAQTTGSFAGDLERLVQRLVGAGFSRILRVDLSREEIGVPVVMMVVPGARVMQH